MSDLWLIDYEQAQEHFASGWLDEDEFRHELKRLGLDDDMIDDEVAFGLGLK